jgi:ABC-type nickel/cobalt efflux system permease component RcnA
LPQAGFPLWTTLALALVLGLRHALEPDHVAAVSTFSSHERNPIHSSLLGAYWGVGHTAALLAFGMAIAMFRLALTPLIVRDLDFVVGVMLIGLGVNVLVKLNRGGIAVHVHTHEHDGQRHSHLHIHAGSSAHEHEHRLFRVAGKPFLVGVVHGLAGTGAVMLMIVTVIPSLLLATGFLLVFGVGVIGSMMAMSLLMSVPGAFTVKRTLGVERAVQVASGIFSLGLGLYLAGSVGFEVFKKFNS